MDQTTTLDDRVATEIRAELGRQNMSRAALARALGMTKFSLNRRLVGDVELTANEIEKIAEILDVSVWQLLQPKHEEMDRRHGPVFEAVATARKSRGGVPGQMEL